MALSAPRDPPRRPCWHGPGEKTPPRILVALGGKGGREGVFPPPGAPPRRPCWHGPGGDEMRNERLQLGIGGAVGETSRQVDPTAPIPAAPAQSEPGPVGR